MTTNTLDSPDVRRELWHTRTTKLGRSRFVDSGRDPYTTMVGLTKILAVDILVMFGPGG